MSRCGRGWLALLALLLLLPISAGAAPPTAKEIEEQISKLGDDDDEVRQEASKKLEKFGEPAIVFLRRAATKSADPEIRLRATVVASSIEKKLLGQFKRHEDHKDMVLVAAFTPDGKYILSGGGGKSKDDTWPA